MTKLDYKKELKEFYFPSAKEAALVTVPEMKFIMVDGRGDPTTSPLFQDAMQTLYGLAYTIKFMLKKGNAREYVVPPLEGLWWMENMKEFSLERKDDWLWTVMIRQPDWVREEHFIKVKEEIAKKKGDAAPKLLSPVRFESFQEGLSAQIMHIGPFSTEGPTVQKLHRFIEEKGLALRGKHHEIYMSDFRKTAPEKLKTVIRQPIG